MQRTGWWPPTTHAVAVAVAVASDVPSLLSIRFGDPRVTFAFVFRLRIPGMKIKTE
jgi:hypothetical protein